LISARSAAAGFSAAVERFAEQRGFRPEGAKRLVCFAPSLQRVQSFDNTLVTSMEPETVLRQRTCERRDLRRGYNRAVERFAEQRGFRPEGAKRLVRFAPSLQRAWCFTLR